MNRRFYIFIFISSAIWAEAVVEKDSSIKRVKRGFDLSRNNSFSISVISF